MTPCSARLSEDWIGVVSGVARAVRATPITVSGTVASMPASLRLPRRN